MTRKKKKRSPKWAQCVSKERKRPSPSFPSKGKREDMRPPSKRQARESQEKYRAEPHQTLSLFLTKGTKGLTSMDKKNEQRLHVSEQQQARNKRKQLNIYETNRRIIEIAIQEKEKKLERRNQFRSKEASN